VGGDREEIVAQAQGAVQCPFHLFEMRDIVKGQDHGCRMPVPGRQQFGMDEQLLGRGRQMPGDFDAA